MKTITHHLVYALLTLSVVFVGMSFIGTYKNIKQSQITRERASQITESHMYSSAMRMSEETEYQRQLAATEHYKQIECLAKNMYFEARGEGSLGQDAVAFVTINRVQSDRYPDTICEVVYQAKTNSRGQPLRNRCQFSWFCDGKSDTIRESIYPKLRARAEYIYINYYLNDYMTDITDGATHYHSKQVTPYWSQHTNYQLVASIGQHVFYQPTY